MSYIDDKEMREYERQMQLEERKAAAGGGGEISMDMQASELRDREKNVIKEQLNLGEILENLEHLLRGEILGMTGEGTDRHQDWVKPTDNDMKVLSDYGVHLIMNTICFYLNQNTLLSNYSEETILAKMEDFATSLTDAIFMKYEKCFYYPTSEDCEKVLNDRIKKKVEIRVFSLKLQGIVVSKEKEKEIETGIKLEMKDRIEHELQSIREQLIKDKLKNFDLIMREVQDAVHSTYLRAWNGQERRTLREHIHVSESLGFHPPMAKKSQGGYNPASWLRR